MGRPIRNPTSLGGPVVTDKQPADTLPLEIGWTDDAAICPRGRQDLTDPAGGLMCAPLYRAPRSRDRQGAGVPGRRRRITTALAAIVLLNTGVSVVAAM